MIKELGSYVRILRVLEDQYQDGLTIRQLAQQTGGSYGWAHATCASMIENDILVARRIGHAVVCSVNTRSEVAASLLEIGHILERNAAGRPGRRTKSDTGHRHRRAVLLRPDR